MLYFKFGTHSFNLWKHRNSSGGWWLTANWREALSSSALRSPCLFVVFDETQVQIQLAYAQTCCDTRDTGTKQKVGFKALKCIMCLTEGIIGSLEPHSPAVNLRTARWWSRISTRWQTESYLYLLLSVSSNKCSGTQKQRAERDSQPRHSNSSSKVNKWMTVGGWTVKFDFIREP